LVPQLKAGQLVVMYNYSFRKSNKTKEIVEKAGYKILFLFLYSPDFNPIENYWAALKARIKKIKINAMISEKLLISLSKLIIEK
jgi:transposase